MQYASTVALEGRFRLFCRLTVLMPASVAHLNELIAAFVAGSNSTPSETLSVLAGSAKIPTNRSKVQFSWAAEPILSL
jgi:hypothetical protein